LFCTLSLGLVYISNANPACSCVYICKFQFRPIHPPLGDYHYLLLMLLRCASVLLVGLRSTSSLIAWLTFPLSLDAT
jgi:hypothetical protein